MTYRIVEEAPPVTLPDAGRFAVYEGPMCFERFQTLEEAEQAIRRWTKMNALTDELRALVEEFGERHSLSNREIREMIRDFE